jgi:ubiquinone/menaquinone biosynthesis C-methylase UbiE
MNNLSEYINELKTAEAFSRQSAVFDKEYCGNTIIKYKRQRVREHVLSFLSPPASILELNSGTGEDALFFAEKGFSVHATDVSEGMQKRLKEKLADSHHGDNVTAELCSFTELQMLQQKGPFELVFSNFGGLNCTGELKDVLLSLSPLIKPGGMITLVIISKFCLWEILLFFKGQFKTATRRLFSAKGRKAHIEGVNFKCWYYSPGFIINSLKDQFELVRLEGLCTIVPPSYVELFAEKHPKTYIRLVNLENKLSGRRPWRNIGDYFIISLRKKN